MPEIPQCQVAIHIQDKAIKFSEPSYFFEYIDNLRKQARHFDKDLRLWIEDWQRYEHFPLAIVIDDESGEFFVFEKKEKLPTETLTTGTGKKLIVFETPMP